MNFNALYSTLVGYTIDYNNKKQKIISLNIKNNVNTLITEYDRIPIEITESGIIDSSGTVIIDNKTYNDLYDNFMKRVLYD